MSESPSSGGESPTNYSYNYKYTVHKSGSNESPQSEGESPQISQKQTKYQGHSPAIPNAQTREAMKEAREIKNPRFNTAEELIENLEKEKKPPRPFKKHW